MPSNKIGGLQTGQGLRRIQAQRKGNWRGYGAQSNFEIGAELKPQPASPDRPTRSSRHSGANP
ncbi:MAG TPA: hypothetical protein VNT01_06145 [Symbiobacteriaceae bacterium]|nr:hypothetical protein [Symbiobacteriaceae bacterium]